MSNKRNQKTKPDQPIVYQIRLQGHWVARFIGNGDLLAGNWREALAALLRQPRTWPGLPADGAEVAAEILEGLLPKP